MKLGVWSGRGGGGGGGGGCKIIGGGGDKLSFNKILLLTLFKSKNLYYKI